MPTISQLTSVDNLASSDQVPIYSGANGDARKASFNTITTYLSGKITAIDTMVTQYSAPSTTGFTTNIFDGPTSVWLILTPTGTMAAGTVKLPTSTNCVDRQEVLLNSTQIVTTLTLNGNGATVTGAPTTLSANGFFKLRYDAVTTTWYRIG